MRVSIFIIVLCTFLSCNTNNNSGYSNKTRTDQIIRFENFSSKFTAMKDIDVWLPSNYKNFKNCNVIYMHDGQMLFDTIQAWNNQEWGVDETLDSLIKNKTIEPTIVVAIHNNAKKRHNEYFPQKPFESFSKKIRDSIIINSKASGNKSIFAQYPNSDSYIAFIATELKPFIDAEFKTNSAKSSTFIAGSSMGALISMYALCEYPNTFGGAACLSTHWTGTFDTLNNPIPNAFFKYLNKNLPSPWDHKIYFDTGTETLDASYQKYHETLTELIRKKRLPENSFMIKKFDGHRHDEASWNKRLNIPIEFLLKK